MQLTALLSIEQSGPSVTRRAEGLSISTFTQTGLADTGRATMRFNALPTLNKPTRLEGVQFLIVTPLADAASLNPVSMIIESGDTIESMSGVLAYYNPSIAADKVTIQPSDGAESSEVIITADLSNLLSRGG